MISCPRFLKNAVGGSEHKRKKLGLWYPEVPIFRCEEFPSNNKIENVSMGTIHCSKMEKIMGAKKVKNRKLWGKNVGWAF